VTWLRRYRLRHLLRYSFWLVPVVFMLAAMLLVLALRWVDALTGWSLMNYTADGARQLLGGLSSSMLTFLVFAVSVLLLALQLASSQLSPRIIAIAFASRGVQVCVGIFVFSYTLALAAGARVEDDHVPQLLVFVAVLSNLLSLIVFFWFVHHVGSALRPVALLQKLADAGRRVVNEVYPTLLGHSGSQQRKSDTLPEPSRVIEHAGASGTFLAFGPAELVEAARRADCVIALIPQVGDFVARGDPLFRIHPADREIDPASLRAMVAFGPERTMEQDPAFSFRIMVDIASRALSPAVNDPTTAVLALDQIHSELLYLGKKLLDRGSASDEGGRLRLVYPTPQWEDFVALGVTEIRHFGASSIQVARRLRAMLEHLIGALHPSRVAPLREQLAMLEHSVERAFPEAEDLRRAQTGDVQGMGHSAAPKP
jgi:uncharacterized membrane protein